MATPGAHRSSPSRPRRLIVLLLLDSNLIIFARQPAYRGLRTFIARHAPSVSAVSKVEVLGYHALTQDETQSLAAFFEAAQVLPISERVIDHAVELRQRRRMSLGDALIAGTALAINLVLATHNTDDFDWIDALTVTDPLRSTE